MDSELFTVGGDPQKGRDWTGHERSLPDGTQAQVFYQTAKLARSARWCVQALYWLFVFLTLYVIVSVWPMMLSAWSKGLKEVKSGFTQKEGLQYLGASFDVRQDTGYGDKLSPVEIAAQREQQQVTTNMAVAPAKSGFRTERMTPEEKLLEQQKK